MLVRSRFAALGVRWCGAQQRRVTYSVESGGSSVPETLRGNGVLGIRREDKNRWERRAPLAPSHVKNLTSNGVKVVVQPSNLRIASDAEYKEAGAQISEDLSGCNVVMGVKEVPINLLLPDRTYCFFSHTIKGQEANMALLDACLERNIRLLDYERIAEQEGNRLVKFGKFAGFAGMIDFFHGIGDRLLAMGYSTPFLHVGLTHMYNGLPAAEEAVKLVGQAIAKEGTPRELGPLTFVFTGTGSVSRGAQHIFSLLPHKMVEPEELQRIVADKNFDNTVVYGTVASSKHLVRPLEEGAQFDKKEFYAHPENYHSVFADTIAPYASFIVTGHYWDQRYPRMLTTEQVEHLHSTRRSRLLGIADLSCDPEGSIEILKTTSSIDHPFYLYDVDNREVNWDVANGKGILMLAVDNLPTEIPVDATQYFGEALLPWVEPLVFSDASVPFEQQDLPGPLKRAVVTSHGQLTPDFAYIADLRKARKAAKSGKEKRILVLGSGMVSPPAIEYLARFKENNITVASDNLQQAEQRAVRKQNVKAIELDVADAGALKSVIGSHDLVISLLPASMHTPVAKICVDKKVHLVTTSYASDEMMDLNESARSAGITILNEVGLDPGIDHLSAMKVIRQVQEEGGQVTSFTSYCGGLPAPEASDNPFGYKFSWAPKGALLAGLNPAAYRDAERNVKLPSGTVFSAAEPVEWYPGFALEGYPNRDSLKYMQDYGVVEPKRFFRGTLRYQGFCQIFDSLVKLGYVSEKSLRELQPDAPPLSWRGLTQILSPTVSAFDLESGVLRQLGLLESGKEEAAARVGDALEWLGLFDDSVQVPKAKTPIDALCSLMLEKMGYEARERDLVILRHDFVIRTDQGKDRRLSSTLVEYGDPDGHSAMAKTVGTPAAVAAKLILDGHIIRTGVIRPLTPDVFHPLLDRLEDEGIAPIEKYY